MNKDTLQLIGQIILIGFGPLLAKRGISIGYADVDHVVGALSIIGGIIWKFWHWNTTPDSSSGTPTSIPIKQVAAMLLLAGLFYGCAPLQPGADPLVVRVEQTETIAQDTFDQVLAIDNSQRAFYASNAPAFHNFCEWLRQPQTIGTNTLPRSSAMILSLDDVKLDYKSARASSNDLFTALQTVTSALGQANTWLTTGVTTNTSAH